MIAFHFPPIQGSSGIHRTLAFARYLRDFGWEPIVLTADPRAYPAIRDENWALVPPHVEVIRTFARDSARDLAFFGRYPKWLAMPDRWATWAVSAVAKGLAVVKRRRPDVIFSTYPIASAHLAGAMLTRMTKIPWVADFRDPMAEPGHPADKTRRRIYQWLEREAAARAARLLVTTQGTKKFYEETYLDGGSDRVVVIENGFDEELPAEAAGAFPGHSERDKRLLLLHSGVIYPRQRNPAMLFAALAELKSEGRLGPEDLEVRLRASGHEENYRRRIEDLGIADIVSLCPPVTYQEATREMEIADGLLLLQSDVCDRQIPAKAYEYLRARKPILGLASPQGDTGQLLLKLGISAVAALEDKESIKRSLLSFISDLRQGRYELPAAEAVAGLSRRARTAELATLLDTL